MKITTSFAILLLLTGCATTENKTPIPDKAKTNEQVLAQMLCENAQCRKDVRVVLKDRDQHTFDKTYSVMPVINDLGVMVVAGQTVMFEATVVGDELTNLKLVDKNVHPEKTIIAQFYQQNEQEMVLILKQPFDRPLKAHMLMMPLESEEFFATSSCAVPTKVPSAEIWPFPIFQIMLTDFKFVPAKELHNCVE